MMSGTMPTDIEIELVCVECGAESEDGAVGWRAFLTVDDDVAVYCGDCAREEFGSRAALGE